jgi:hypothetical protein
MLIGIQANAIGRLQDADFKTLTQITNAGGTAASLLNDSKIYVGANGINQTLNSAIASGLIGGGAGINLVSNGSFEASGVAGWATFRTTLSSLVPTSAPATCASCSITVTANTAAPLNGKASLQLTAASQVSAGDGFISNAFTVSPAYQGQVVTIKGVSSLVSGTPSITGDSTGTFAIYMYDVTNAAWLQPVGVYAIASKAGPFSPSSFQIPSNTTSMRLAVLAVNALASPTTLLFDDLAVAPGLNNNGYASSDLKVVPNPVVTATTATSPTRPTSGVTEVYRVGQAGDHAHVIWNYSSTVTTGAVTGSGDYLFTLPSGLSFDLNKVTLTGGAALGSPFVATNGLGSATLSDGSSNFVGQVFPYDATHYRVAGIYANNTNGKIGALGSSFFPFGQSAVQKFSVDFFAPIAGWSSNVTQSSDYDGRNVNFNGTQSATVANNVNIPMTALIDRAGAWNGTVYTVQAAGDYFVTGASVSAGTGTSIGIYLNGALYNRSLGNYVSATSTSTQVNMMVSNLKVGDTLSIQGLGTGGSFSNGWMSITRFSGSSPVIQASQSVTATVYLSASQSVAANGVIKYDTKARDTANSFSTTTGLFTAPIPGTYHVQFTGYSNSTYTTYLKPSTGLNQALVATPGGATSVVFNGGTDIYLSQGMTVGVYTDTAGTFAGPSGNNGILNQVTFQRTGN